MSEFRYDAAGERVVLVLALAMLRGARAPGDDSPPEEVRRRASGFLHSLAPDEFLHPLHSALWRSLTFVADRALHFDVEVLTSLAVQEGQKREEAQPYLDGLVADSLAEDYVSGVLGNAEHHTSRMREDAASARALRDGVPELAAALKDSRGGVERALRAARAVLSTLEAASSGSRVRRADELRRSYGAELGNRVGQGNFYASGYPAVDGRLSEGTMPGRTAALAGLSSSGKSSFVCDWAWQLACQYGRKVLLCAWEMGAESTLDVMVSQRTRIPLRKVVQGDMTADELRAVQAAKDAVTSRILFQDNPFFLADKALRRDKQRRYKPGNDDHLELVERTIATSGCDVVVYDLWDRMLCDMSPDAVTYAINQQVELHKTYNVYGVLVLQLNLKTVGQRADKRPRREDVKGVGSFIEMADQVWAVHREGGSGKDVPDKTLELVNLKQKKGPGYWSTLFQWDAECSLPYDGVVVPYNAGGEEVFGDVSGIKTKRRQGGREG